LLGASVCVLLPSLASEWRRCSASSTGTSSMESVESCGMHTREAIFRRHTLQRHMVWEIEGERGGQGKSISIAVATRQQVIKNFQLSAGIYLWPHNSAR